LLDIENRLALLKGFSGPFHHFGRGFEELCQFRMRWWERVRFQIRHNSSVKQGLFGSMNVWAIAVDGVKPRLAISVWVSDTLSLNETRNVYPSSFLSPAAMRSIESTKSSIAACISPVTRLLCLVTTLPDLEMSRSKERNGYRRKSSANGI